MSVSETSLIMIFLTDCDLYFAKTKFDVFRWYDILYALFMKWWYKYVSQNGGSFI